MLDKLLTWQTFTANSLYTRGFFASSTVVFYDYMLNISREVEYMWKRPRSSVTILFGINRFALLVWAVANMPIPRYTVARNRIEEANPEIRSNADMVLFNACNILVGVVQAIFTATRIYAIGRGRLVLPVLMFTLNLTSTLVPVYALAPESITIAQAEILNNVALACTATSALVDLAAIVLTWRKRQAMNQLGCISRVSLADVLLKDGALYFIALLVLSVSTFGHWYISLESTLHLTAYDITSLIGYFQTPLISIIMSHFLLNLREVAYGPQAYGSYISQGTMDVGFNQAPHHTGQSQVASFVEPMGAPLRHGEDVDDEDTQWEYDLSAHTGVNGEDVWSV
ncbi:hypothetical protein CERSUDRAFT_116736 [Gelatoporia subvermispora B]|uniref:DUF6533 domain-containing protein n=1 Tax=Ceriporiopsis subvermispora (strain B) TaxID=914234 RepID=M2QC41_CERS8|nr:hypothetical protein CERSUDRAFT_116736 [Gelatoporia subvermispora B]